MKRCSACKIDQPIKNFYKRKRAPDGLSYRCKTCANISHKVSRSKKVEHYNDVRRVRSESKREAFREWKANQECYVCDESDIACLDLHHLDPNTKDINIADAISSWSFERLQLEIDKCVVLCSNCHRKVHADRVSLVIH